MTSRRGCSPIAADNLSDVRPASIAAATNHGTVNEPGSRPLQQGAPVVSMNVFTQSIEQVDHTVLRTSLLMWIVSAATRIDTVPGTAAIALATECTCSTNPRSDDSRLSSLIEPRSISSKM